MHTQTRAVTFLLIRVKAALQLAQVANAAVWTLGIVSLPIHVCQACSWPLTIWRCTGSGRVSLSHCRGGVTLISVSLTCTTS